MIWRRLAALCAAIVLCSPAAAAPLDAYGRLPDISNVVLSPDGDRVAYISPSGEGEGVIAVALNPTKRLFGGKFGDEKLRGLVWADETHLLVIRSVTKQPDGVSGPRAEWSILYSVDLTTGKVTRLLDNVPNSMNIIDGTPEVRRIDGRTYVFASGVTFVEDQGSSALFRIDLASGTITRPAGLTGAGDWVIDQQGHVQAETAYSEIKHQWELWLDHHDGAKVGYSVPSMIEAPTYEGLSPDGSAVILRMVEKGQDIYRAVSLKDGTPGEPIKAYEGFSSLIVDPVTRRVVGGVKIGAVADYVFFDPKDQAKWDLILKRFPDEDVEFESWSNDRSRVVVSVTGQTHGFAYVLVDTKSGGALEIGDAYASLKPDDIAAVEEIQYGAADGRKIPAFLTLPNNRPAKALPLVVLPHGGPADMDPPGFDWWAQALAAQGYAVLQPEFRGSDGYGWEFMAAGFGEWGRKMQTDLSDGVRALAKAGIIDAKRVCIVGASYGGYAALAGAALDPGVYRCAVSVSGISDLRRMLGWEQSRSDGPNTPGIRYWDRYMGSKNPNDPALDAISPIKHLDRVAIPVLLIHGKDDTVVPIEQSQTMADALKAAGKPVELVILPGEDHWLSRSETRLQMLEATVKFVEANNPS